jgi:ankyrin repeat protein
MSVVQDHTSAALQLLFHCPSCVNVCDSTNNLPLHYAVRNGNPQLVSALLNNGML